MELNSKASIYDIAYNTLFNFPLLCYFGILYVCFPPRSGIMDLSLFSSESSFYTIKFWDAGPVPVSLLYQRYSRIQWQGMILCYIKKCCRNLLML